VATLCEAPLMRNSLRFPTAQCNEIAGQTAAAAATLQGSISPPQPAAAMPGSGRHFSRLRPRWPTSGRRSAPVPADAASRADPLPAQTLEFSEDADQSLASGACFGAAATTAEAAQQAQECAVQGSAERDLGGSGLCRNFFAEPKPERPVSTESGLSGAV